MDRTDLGNVAQAARMQYSTGVRELNKAERLRQKAATLTDPKSRSKTEEKAQNALESADKAFREALSYDDDLIAAYAGLGTALRLQGKTEEALQVHAMALRRAPDDLENFAGWTESMLALTMFGNLTSAYSDYVQSNQARAEILMSAIENWLTDKKTDPGDLDPADLQRLADWVALQKQG
jgi:tetratricopeptide (TPR) repeat protein